LGALYQTARSFREALKRNQQPVARELKVTEDQKVEKLLTAQRETLRQLTELSDALKGADVQSATNEMAHLIKGSLV
jgi:hypothetical protein